MSRNLKNRLRYIRDVRKDSAAQKTGPALRPKGAELNESPWPGWFEAGFMVYKRELTRELPFSLSAPFSEALAILVPDLFRIGRIPLPGELLFFDLETTGLSGGAGTVAFLAAFGRFSPQGKLVITQYLLLDYPGEADFVESVKSEFASPRSPNPIVVSYNGKCFDAQILKTRCLMNGLVPPEFFHVDLLHPARRLWKGQFSDCSQATIEVSALGLDRSGDISGAFAPEIWFSFLRSGENKDLLVICEHNVKDIMGLASLFLGFHEIASEPFESRKKFRFCQEALALSWQAAVKKNAAFLAEKKSYQKQLETGKLLLKNAAHNGCPRAAFTLYKSLAIEAEWRLRDNLLALCYTKSALSTPEITGRFRSELELRLKRLEEKTG